jgi:hypothetical protein
MRNKVFPPLQIELLPSHSLSILESEKEDLDYTYMVFLVAYTLCALASSSGGWSSLKHRREWQALLVTFQMRPSFEEACSACDIHGMYGPSELERGY